MTTTLFMEHWQIQCCGEPFGVGDNVSWPTTPVTGRSFLDFLGDRAGEVDAYEDHHLPGEPVVVCEGVVSAIEAVFCLYEHVSGQRFRPRLGTTEFQTRSFVDGREPYEPIADVHRRFVGYLIAID